MKDVVINANLLKGKIIEKGMTTTILANKLGIDRATLYRHMNNGRFSLKEIVGIRELLNLSDEESSRIFFG